MKISIVIEDMPGDKTKITYVYPPSHNSTTSSESRRITNAERVARHIEELVRTETLLPKNFFKENK